MPQRLTLENFIKKSNEKHHNKYDYSKSIYVSVGEKILIICNNHNSPLEFWQKPNDHMAGHGCRSCGNNEKHSNEYIDNYLIENNKTIKRIEKYIGAHKSIKWQCLKCNNIFEASFVLIRFTNNYCKSCDNIYYNLIIDEQIKSKNIKKISNYISWHKEMDWECLKCGIFWKDKYSNIKNKYGCEKCSLKERSFTNEYIDNLFLEKNILIKRIGEYINIRTKIDWQCLKCENIWTSTPSSIIHCWHLCPICNKSKGEQIANATLFKLKLIFKSQYRLQNTNFRLDFYLIDYNVALEINGIQHYQPTKFSTKQTDIEVLEKFEKQKLRDNNLRNYCKDNNIKLIEIDMREIKLSKLENYITNLLNIEINIK